ncbi:HpcH/HpaI aldolase/citrate lyase family protein [Rhizodiscina lignyota]|uniref:HpcH/HpaI aldolase/citrate lyase family protein n=1 Tax=Rhizodiscina lignyota TaxID=1504668 RepID=A0A9P4M368_9PEZI|nr:HpcH/HpaI aldolase/citrate lyase family protein [Rhizodiscina lignyota]
MQAVNRLQKALKAGGPSFGVWQTLPGANLSRFLARSGVDWVCLDCEHGNISDSDMHDSVAAIAALGVSPIVRIPGNEAWMVKRALDTGAQGVLVPLLYTVDDAKRVVSSAKFPPTGTRGFGSPFAHHAWNLESQTQYLKEANDAIITLVQIETKEALDNVDAIAKVPGVDVLLIGPFDLGNNIGHPILDGVMKPELHAAIDKIHQAALNNGKSTGIFCTSGEQANEYAKKGYHMVTVAGDMILLPNAVSNALKTAKGEGVENGGEKPAMSYDGRSSKRRKA